MSQQSCNSCYITAHRLRNFSRTGGRRVIPAPGSAGAGEVQPGVLRGAVGPEGGCLGKHAEQAESLTSWRLSEADNVLGVCLTGWRRPQEGKRAANFCVSVGK